MSVSESQLVNHLLFHKALIDEGGASGRVDEYIRLVKERGAGAHVGIDDPFDRSISLAFELVLDQGLDPWAIDLVQFASLYMGRVKERPELDLITAGRLLLMAWTILKMQSERLRDAAEPPVPPETPEEDPWAGIDSSPWLTDEADFAYTTRVLETGAPLDEKIRHKGDRKVTLMELVEALEAAKREADLRAEIVSKRESDKATRRAAQRGRVDGAAHKEDQERDIAEVWERIEGQGAAAIPITDIHAPTREDLVKTLVSVLFLARESRVRIWQDDFPYGMIYVQKDAPGDAT